jgi:hypothetical protein
MLRIGLDFDNTIVCYDRLFHLAARDVGLIPSYVPQNKNAVRDYLRAQCGEQEWIALQGEVYGRRMHEADPFPGLLAFLRQAKQADISLSIVSHKTRHPVLGEHWDLHECAREWLARHLAPDLIAASDIHFELTKDEKLARMARCGCDAFIDDLPEVLLAPGFPRNTAALLFDPADHFGEDGRYIRVRSWSAVGRHFELEGVGL